MPNTFSRLTRFFTRQAASAEWHQTLEQAPDAVVSIDADNRVVFFNAAAERLWGYRRDDVIGQNVKLLVPLDLRHRHDDDIHDNRRTVVDKIVGSSREVLIERKDGSKLWADISFSKVRQGRSISYTAFLKDITDEVNLRNERHLLSLIAHETRNAILIVDEQKQVVFVNEGFTRLLGYRLADTQGRPLDELLSGPETDPVALKRTCEWGYGHADGTYEELLLYGKQGAPIWMSASINPAFDEQGRFKRAIVVLTDISEAKQLQLLQEDTLAVVAGGLPMIPVVANQLTYDTLAAVAGGLPVTDVMERICRQVERMAPQVVASVLRIDPERKIRPLAAPSLPEWYVHALDGLSIGPVAGSCGTAAYRGETVIVTDIATDPLWAAYKELIPPLGFKSCWSTPIKSRNGQVVGTFAFYYREPMAPTPFQQRIVNACVHLCALALEREEANARILELALYDELTGLPNRWLLREKVGQAIVETAGSGAPIAFLFLDLDRFKHVNDSLGHPIGDQLLSIIARRLKRQGQEDRIVSRLGGDEFVVVLPGCDAERARVEMERILEQLAEPVQINGLTITPSVSIGISLFPHDGEDIDTLFKHADMAMYQAKAAGRGTFRFFSYDLNRHAQERLVLEAALREALQQGQLQLHYQPQVRLDRGTLHGVEALARWHHPIHGHISPGRFIPLAEECGLSDAVGLWSLATACAQLADWRRRGIAVPSVSVNLSPLQFRNPLLTEHVSGMLREHQLMPADLKLEITESTMLDHSAQTRATVSAIHELGVGLAMDDFGTGYSCLSQLGSLPINELKIDQSFVRQLEDTAQSRALTATIIHLGESLNLTLVAEGVETEFQRRFLQENGCHIIQGFLLARPLPANELEAWLSQHRPCAREDSSTPIARSRAERPV